MGTQSGFPLSRKSTFDLIPVSPINLFKVVCLVTWPLNESEAVGDLVMIETSLLLLCKFLLISMRTASLT